MKQSLLINSFLSIDSPSGSKELFNYFQAVENWSPPEDDFILCRNKNGIPTAIYGKSIWDFRPYNMGTTSYGIIDFNIFDDISLNPHQIKLIIELKELTFLCIYQKRSNKHLSTKTLLSKFNNLKRLAIYSYSSGFDRTILSTLSNEILLSHFLQDKSNNEKQEISALIFSLKVNHSDILKSKLVDFKNKRKKSNQTSVIPSRIYFETFQRLNKEVDKLHKIKDQIRELIKEFSSPHKGLNLKRYTDEEAHNSLCKLIKKHELENFFVGSYSVSQKQNLLSIIGNIQSTCAYSIYLYTAMRKEELLNCSFNCVANYDLTPLDVKNNSSELSKFVNIISTTTKFSGYRKKVGWLSPKEVIKAVAILQAITEGVAFLFDSSPEKLPLLHSAKKIFMNEARLGNVYSAISKKPICLEDLTITSADKEELINTDHYRSFHEHQFKIGKKWHFTCHQFRRSLAFYGANSNLISESTGAILYKHLNNEMQRYYRRGFERIKCLLGYINSDTGEVDLPPDHFIFEFQTGISIEQARSLINTLIPEKSSRKRVLLGKRGKALSRNLLSKKPYEFNIFDIRAETEKSVENGEIAYKNTLLGGCMKTGKCNDYMLGNFTHCLDCSEAIIDPSKITAQINKSKAELKTYSKDSAEYQLVNREYQTLLKFHSTKDI